MKIKDKVKAVFSDGDWYPVELIGINKAGDKFKVSDGTDTWVVTKDKIKPIKPVRATDKEAKKAAIEKEVNTAFDVSDFFDVEEKETKLNSISVSAVIDPATMISTGILSLDLVLGGGLKAGRWYDYVGPESSGKTTALYHALSSALREIPNNLKGVFLDVEGLIDHSWFSNISGVEDLNAVYGLRDDDGSWLVKPQIRYYKPAFGERGLQFIKKALKRMPDKVQIKDTWYYLFAPSTAKNVKKAGGYNVKDLQSMLKGKYISDLFRRTGNFYVPIPNNYAGPELLIGVDSWASMTPEAIAEDNSDALGGPARMFGKYLNDIKSLIAAKGCTVIGINQAREKPMGFGDPEYYPGGNTLKHACDARVRFGAVSNQNGSGPVEHEDGDSYRWAKIKVKKNKVFVPFKECRLRWWTEHDGFSGSGADPVLDTLEYLKMTGQFETTKKGFKVVFAQKTKFTDVEFTYDSFKQDVTVDNKYGIRSACLKQLKSGKAIKLYLNAGLEE